MWTNLVDNAASAMQGEGTLTIRTALDNDRLLVVSLQPGLPNGVYAVVWRSLSAIDVHPDEGQSRLFVEPWSSAVSAR